MGAKQSSPAAAASSNGRTRAYSGSDLPSATSSSNGRTSAAGGVAMRYHHQHHHHHHAHHHHHHHHGGSPGTTSAASGAGGGGGGGPRGTRTVGGGSSAGGVGGAGGTTTTTRPQSGINIPNSGGGGAYGSHSHQGSGSSTPEESSSVGGERDRSSSSGGRGDRDGPRLLIGSLPAHLSPHLFGGFKCPVCSKFVSSDEMDLHLVMCLTKPRVTYNEDVLTKDAGECAICLEELVQGDTIARLPCLCIYHKGCIDEWFEVNRSCPEHPSD